MYDWKDLRKIRPEVFAETRAKMDEILAEGHKRLYVTCTIDEEFTPEGYIKAAVNGRLKREARSPSELEEKKAQTPWKEEQRAQRRRMTRKIDRIRDLLYGIYEDKDIGRLGSYMPHFTLKVDHDIIDILEQIPEVVHIVPQRVFKPELYDAWHTVRVQTSWDFGYGGQGKCVVVIDTGVDRTHSMFTGRIVEEVCYSSGGNCPNNTTYQIGVGAAMPRMDLMGEAYHGTHVAGIAAGNGLYRGMAWGADIVAINVFSKVGNSAGAYGPDIIAGMNAAYNMRELGVAAVNLSLGSGGYSSYCDSYDPAMTSIVANMTSSGIAVVVAAGNADSTMSIEGTAKSLVSWPGCIASAISVGATTKAAHKVPSWSMSWNNPGQPHVDIYAPGYEITSAYPDEQYAVASGTSMAAPFITGIIALLRAVEQGRDSFMDVETLVEKLRDYADWAYDTYNDGSSCPLKRLVQVDDFVFSEFEYKVSPPQLSPERGGRNRPFDVRIYSNRMGAKVRYTDNGLDPSPIYGTLITSEERVRVSGRTILKAIAYSDASEFLPSTVTEGVYDVWQSEDTSIGVPEDDSVSSVRRAVRKSPGLLEYPDTRFVRVVDFSQGKMPVNYRENRRDSIELEPVLFNVKNSSALDSVFEAPLYSKLLEWGFPVHLIGDNDMSSVDFVKYAVMVIRSPGMVYEAHPYVAAGNSFKDLGINIVCLCAHTSFHDFKMSSLEGYVTTIGQERFAWSPPSTGSLLLQHPITKGMYGQNMTVNQMTAASRFQSLFGTPINCDVLFYEGVNSTGIAVAASNEVGSGAFRCVHFGGHKDLSYEGYRLLLRSINWAKTPGDSRVLGERLLSKVPQLEVGDHSTLCVSAMMNCAPSSLKITPLLIDEGEIVGVLEPKDVMTLGSFRKIEHPVTKTALFYLSSLDAGVMVSGNTQILCNQGLTLGKDTSDQVWKIYLRFPNLPIPSKSTILSAKIGMVGRLAGDGGDAHARITSYSFGDCPPLSTQARGETPYPLNLTGYSFDPAGLWQDWLFIPPTVVDDTTYTPDISKLLQRTVDRLDWKSGNAWGVIITDSEMALMGQEYGFMPIQTRGVKGALRYWHTAVTKAPGPWLEVVWAEGGSVFPTSVQKWDVAGGQRIALAITDYRVPTETAVVPEINAWFV